MTGGRWRAALAGLSLVGLMLAPGAAQDVFNGRSTAGPQAPVPEQYDGGDLHKYLSPDGLSFDRCGYWHDHPDFNTQYYGWPDHFAAGQPIGNTNSYNGRPAPYASCAADPCNRGGVICWRNKPSVPTGPNAQMQAVLRAQGCTVDGNGAITCPSRIPGHGSRCHVTLNGGIACNTSDEPPATQSATSNPPCASFSPPQQVALRKTGIEALDMAAGAGQQADHMLQVFGYAVASGIAELRDAQAFTQQQKANVAGVLKLLSLPNAQFHQVLSGSVSDQVQDLERDPSGYLGGAAAAYFFSHGVSGAGACMAAAGKKTVAAVNKAARRLRQIANRFPRAIDPLKRGMPLADDTALRDLAKSRRWIIVVRDSNPAAMKWVGDPRALPKPMDLKAKSIPYDPAKPMRAQPNAGLATAKGLPAADVAKLK